MTNIKFAIFDVGKTIYPFSLSPLIKYMERETAEPDLFYNQHTPRFYDYNPYMKGELTDSEFAEELCFFCRVPYNNNRLADISSALHKGCGARFPQTIQAMYHLRQNNIEICLLSNALPLLADTGADITKPQYAFTSYELGLLKPDTAIFHTVAERLHTPPQQLLFIDDKPANVAASKNVGLNGIVYQKETILRELNLYLPPSANLSRSPRV